MAARLAAVVAREGFREYYEARTGCGMGAHDFGWSTLLWELVDPAASYSGVSVRTLVISDLHLGSRLGRDVLRHPEALAVLLDAFDGIDRLVLLGDVDRARRGAPAPGAWSVAEPVLRAIGERMGAERQIVFVPGNHDRALTRSWARAQGARLTVDTLVPPRCHRAAGQGRGLAGARAGRGPHPRRVAVARASGRPMAITSIGTCCRSGGATGCTAVVRFGSGSGRRSTSARDGPSMTWVETLLTRWLPRPLAAAADSAAELLRASTMPSLARRMHSHRLAPLTRRVLGMQMQRAPTRRSRMWCAAGRRGGVGDLRARPPKRAARGRRRPRCGRARRPAAVGQHRLLALRAAAAAPRRRAAPVLAGWCGDRRRRGRPGSGGTPGRVGRRSAARGAAALDPLSADAVARPPRCALQRGQGGADVGGTQYAAPLSFATWVRRHRGERAESARRTRRLWCPPASGSEIRVVWCPVVGSQDDPGPVRVGASSSGRSSAGAPGWACLTRCGRARQNHPEARIVANPAWARLTRCDRAQQAHPPGARG